MFNAPAAPHSLQLDTIRPEIHGRSCGSAPSLTLTKRLQPWHCTLQETWPDATQSAELPQGKRPAQLVSQWRGMPSMKAPHDSKLSGFGGGSPSRVWITICRNGEVSLVFIKCSSTKRRLPVRVVTIAMGLALLSSCASAVAQTDQTTGQSIHESTGRTPPEEPGAVAAARVEPPFWLCSQVVL
jgi:hypothetical protein